MALLLTTQRRIVQCISLALLNFNAFTFTFGTRFCLPVMNCEACALAWLGCPIGMMGRSIAFLEFPWVPVLLVLGIGIAAGRFLCGWVCPMGFLQDLLYRIPTRKIRLPRWTTWTKYAVLALAVVAAARWLGYGANLFYCSFCPTSGLQVVLPIMIQDGQWTLDGMRAVKMAVVVAVVGMAIFHHRSFCKVMCPVGALIALASRFAAIPLRLDKARCVGCRTCSKSCPMDIPVMQHRTTGAAINRRLECISCLTCRQSCPTGAIAAGRGPERTNRG